MNLKKPSHNKKLRTNWRVKNLKHSKQWKNGRKVRGSPLTILIYLYINKKCGKLYTINYMITAIWEEKIVGVHFTDRNASQLIIAVLLGQRKDVIDNNV